MRIGALPPADRLRSVATPEARWFAELQLWRPQSDDVLTTGAVETAVVLLSGTFDLVANGLSWPARGARTTPFAGRPMAVYLPPGAEFRAGNGPGDGSGEMLLISARQPIAAAEHDAGRQGLSQKPLLPMAGSGKSFDPQTGEWRPAETFPSSPESLPPRRCRRLQVGDVAIERVFAADYKAATLSLDEVLLPAGSTLRLADVPELPACDEVLLFVRPAATARLRRGDDVHELQADMALYLSLPDARELVVASGDDATYLVIAYAGKSRD